MRAREERLPEITGPCPQCGGEIILHTSVNNAEGCVADGDDATCSGCDREGIFHGTPSDGLRVEWETPPGV